MNLSFAGEQHFRNEVSDDGNDPPRRHNPFDEPVFENTVHYPAEDLKRNADKDSQQSAYDAEDHRSDRVRNRQHIHRGGSYA